MKDFQWKMDMTGLRLVHSADESTPRISLRDDETGGSS